MCGDGQNDGDDPPSKKRKSSTPKVQPVTRKPRRLSPTLLTTTTARNLVLAQPRGPISPVMQCVFDNTIKDPFYFKFTESEQDAVKKMASFLEREYSPETTLNAVSSELEKMDEDGKDIVEQALLEFEIHTEPGPDLDELPDGEDDSEPDSFLDDLAEEGEDDDEFPPLNIEFLDIGMGSSTLFVCGDGTTVLIDCGDHTLGSAVPAKDALTYLRKRLLELQELRKLPNPKIDRIYITHPDQDHYNLFPSLFNLMDDKLEVGEFHIGGKKGQYKQKRDVFEVDKGKKKNDKSLSTMADIFADNTVIEYDSDFAGEDAPSLTSKDLGPGTQISFQILGGNAVPLHRETKQNACSLVLLVEKKPMEKDGKPFKVLMMGDGEQTVEEKVVERHKALIEKVDILHIGHHGAELAGTGPFLKVTDPRVAQLSADQVWAHPTRATVTRVIEDDDLRVNEAMENDQQLSIIVGESRGGKNKEHMEEKTTSALLMNVVHQEEDTSGSDKAEKAIAKGDTPMVVTGQQWNVRIRRDNSFVPTSTLADQNKGTEFL